MSLMHQKPSEAGWFYHAPKKRTENPEVVGAPPPSQIPGLGDIARLPPEKPREMVFRDTDSKYIRMAKMGGRKDLLVIRPNSATKKEPKGYPRSDWFYLEDNAQQDRAAAQSNDQEPWKFLLPDYMVHQAMGETTLPEEQHTSPRGGVPMRPAPFATGQNAVSGGQSTTRISPKAKGQSNNVRSSRTMPKNLPLSQDVRKEDTSHMKCRPQPAEKEEPTIMSKLLAYSYEREWHQKHQAEEEKRVKKKDFIKSNVTNNNTDARPPTVPANSARGENLDANNNNEVLTSRKAEQDKKEPFKLSKYKKVTSRLDTRRSTEILTARRK